MQIYYKDYYFGEVLRFKAPDEAIVRLMGIGTRTVHIKDITMLCGGYKFDSGSRIVGVDGDHLFIQKSYDDLISVKVDDLDDFAFTSTTFRKISDAEAKTYNIRQDIAIDEQEFDLSNKVWLVDILCDNRVDLEKFSLKTAVRMLSSLDRCEGMVDSSDCTYCYNCIDAYDCVDVAHCIGPKEARSVYHVDFNDFNRYGEVR